MKGMPAASPPGKESRRPVSVDLTSGCNRIRQSNVPIEPAAPTLAYMGSAAQGKVMPPRGSGHPDLSQRPRREAPGMLTGLAILER